jgi:hypothetical protein
VVAVGSVVVEIEEGRVDVAPVFIKLYISVREWKVEAGAPEF